MTYTVRAHPTNYAGVEFRSRLEARWAAFFDLMGWEWLYEPVDLAGWVPDFHLRFPCFISACRERHELYVEVKPFHTIEDFLGHPVASADPYAVPYPAMFGVDPSTTEWQVNHPGHRGTFGVVCWGEHPSTVHDLWKRAGNVVQWKGGRR